MDNIQNALVQIHQRINAAAAREDRPNTDSIQLVAVSKKQPTQAILQAYAAGQRAFAENRLEEALTKQAELAKVAPDIEWHFIGNVQSRKLKTLVGRFALIHSIDSFSIAQKISSTCQQQGIAKQAVLLQCNVSGEESKSGFAACAWQTDEQVRAKLFHDIGLVVGLSYIRVSGLMTMAPFYDNPARTRPVFCALQELQHALQKRYPNVDWSVLSMGMSQDFEVAIEEGSTMVRLGSVVFGTVYG